MKKLNENVLTPCLPFWLKTTSILRSAPHRTFPIHASTRGEEATCLAAFTVAGTILRRNGVRSPGCQIGALNLWVSFRMFSGDANETTQPPQTNSRGSVIPSCGPVAPVVGEHHRRQIV